jgi:hypothetical protein
MNVEQEGHTALNTGPVYVCLLTADVIRPLVSALSNRRDGAGQSMNHQCRTPANFSDVVGGVEVLASENRLVHQISFTITHASPNFTMFT